MFFSFCFTKNRPSFISLTPLFLPVLLVTHLTETAPFPLYRGGRPSVSPCLFLLWTVGKPSDTLLGHFPPSLVFLIFPLFTRLFFFSLIDRDPSPRCSFFSAPTFRILNSSPSPSDNCTTNVSSTRLKPVQPLFRLSFFFFPLPVSSKSSFLHFFYFPLLFLVQASSLVKFPSYPPLASSAKQLWGL